MIETSKTSIEIHTNSDEVRNQYNAILNCIRGLEMVEGQDDVSEQIATLDDTLNLLKQLLLAAEEEI